MTFEEWQEMRLSIEREVRSLRARRLAGDNWHMKAVIPRKLSRREVEYVEMCLRPVEDVFKA